MKCPRCGYRLNRKKMAADLGSRGGKKSRRVLTSEQARKMSKKRAVKKTEA